MTPDEAWKHLLDPARSEIAEAARAAHTDLGDALAEIARLECVIDRMADDMDDHATCYHDSHSGVDQTPLADKVWRCDGCGALHRIVSNGKCTTLVPV